MRRAASESVQPPPSFPRRLAGLSPSQPEPDELLLTLEHSGQCRLLATRAATRLCSIHRVGEWHPSRCWVIGYGPGTVDVERLAAAFAPNAPLHRLLVDVLAAMRACSPRARADEVAAAADRVTEYFRMHPIVRRSAAQTRRVQRAMRTDDWMTSGDPVDCFAIAERYAAAVAAVSGVRPPVGEAPDLRVLAAFAGVALTDEVSNLAELLERYPEEP